MNDSEFTHFDLFSGIGGFALAVSWLGGRTVGFCECEPYAKRILANHWPAVRCHDDVRTLDGTRYRGVDLVTGGYPCQPFSHAGKRRGAKDDRHLWPEMRRIIDEARPAYVLAENVAGHVTMGLDDVLSDLESIGYACGAIVVPACAVDARHRRDRVWVMGHADRHSESTMPVDAKVAILPDVADADHARREQQRRTEPTSTQHKAAQCGGRWLPEPAVGRVANGIPNRVDRLRGLGNAIVPQVAYEILRTIIP